jgi:hypothetical protein
VLTIHSLRESAGEISFCNATSMPLQNFNCSPIETFDQTRKTRKPVVYTTYTPAATYGIRPI